MQPQQINAIDIAIQGQVDSKGVAYCRLPDDMFEFMQKTAETEKIIGFEWTPGERNFGLILAK